MKVADLPEFFPNVALLDSLGEGAQSFGGSVAGLERFENRFRREHAAFHRHVNALEPLRVEKASGVTDDKAPIDISARHRVPAAIGQRLRAIANELAAVEKFPQKRMRFPGLK